MSHHKDHTVCKRCVLDSSISDITFNSEGCSYCEEYLTRKENYEIQIALAGFQEEDLNIEVKEGKLTVEGNQEPDEKIEFVHQGIDQRKFRRTWSLADTVVVKGAKLVDGILKISLENQIPEEKKPQTIKIKTK